MTIIYRMSQYAKKMPIFGNYEIPEEIIEFPTIEQLTNLTKEQREEIKTTITKKVVLRRNDLKKAMTYETEMFELDYLQKDLRKIEHRVECHIRGHFNGLDDGDYDDENDDNDYAECSNYEQVKYLQEEVDSVKARLDAMRPAWDIHHKLERKWREMVKTINELNK